MKLRSVLIAGVAAAAMPFAGLGEDITLASPTVGWMKVKPTSEYTVIAVPWLGVDGAAVKVKDLVRTDTLNEEDALYVYDKDSKKYLSWTLNASKAWEAATTVGEGGTVAANNASDAGIDMGKALFIKAAKSGEAYPDIYLYGKLADGNATSVTIEGGSAEQGVHNLVASPKHEAFNPNGDNAIVNPAEGDVIILPNGDGGDAKVLTKDSQGWGYYQVTETEVTFNNVTRKKKTQQRVAVNSIPMGTGFWYVSKNPATEDASKTKINW